MPSERARQRQAEKDAPAPVRTVANLQQLGAGRHLGLDAIPVVAGAGNGAAIYGRLHRRVPEKISHYRARRRQAADIDLDPGAVESHWQRFVASVGGESQRIDSVDFQQLHVGRAVQFLHRLKLDSAKFAAELHFLFQPVRAGIRREQGRIDGAMFDEPANAIRSRGRSRVFMQAFPGK